VHPLLTGLVDYAGLFPPARLPLDTAAAQYARHRARPEAPMLARFVVSVAQADALGALLPPDLPTTLAVLGTGGADAEAFLAATADDLAALRAALDAHPALTADAFEVLLPDDLLREPAITTGVLARLDALREEHGLSGLRYFLEVPLTGAGAAALPVLLGIFFEAGAALKLRTGGLTADAFPAVDVLAAALAAAHRAGVAFKCTAGLHHPVRTHRDVGAETHPRIHATMHGFLNVFGGACLLHAGALPPEALPGVLAETDPAAFHLGADGTFAWRDARAAPGAVADARRTFALGFGSCSFDEPVDDLAALGMPVA
jgi:hypothetical protein